MTDNTVLNTGSGGDTVRTIAKTANSPAKSQVVIIDVGGNADASSEVALTSTTKGTQGSALIPTQAALDSGRTFVTLTASRNTGVATETQLTCTQNKGGTTASAASYTVTTGKTLRIQNVSATVRGSSTAAAVNGIVNLRTAASGVATTSPLLVTLDVPAISNTSAGGNGASVILPIPDGLEIASGQQIALSQSCSTTSATVSVTLVGFEY